MKSRWSERIGSPPKRVPRRTRDGAVAKRRRNEHGWTLIEILTAVALLGIVAAIAVPHVPQRTYGLWSAHNMVIADLRRARADALTKGDHFRLQVTTDRTYTVARMRDDDWNGVWEVDGSTMQSKSLPDGITFVGGDDATYEFNTRGLLVVPDGVISLELHDPETGKTRYITVWPSGQVAPTDVPELGS